MTLDDTTPLVDATDESFTDESVNVTVITPESVDSEPTSEPADTLAGVADLIATAIAPLHERITEISNRLDTMENQNAAAQETDSLADIAVADETTAESDDTPDTPTSENDREPTSEHPWWRRLNL